MIVVTTLAIGIGANTAMFGIAGRVLLRPLAFPHAGQLVRIETHYRSTGDRDVGLAVEELDDLRAQTDLFAAVSAVYPADAAMSGTDHAMRVELLATSANYFSLLGVQPQLGRVFGPEDVRDGFADAVVISDGLWHRAFGGDPGVVGRRVRLDNDAYTIVGVAPAGFRHPGPTVDSETDVWGTAGFKALPFPAPQRNARILPGAIARLRDDVSVSAAQQALDSLTATWRTHFPAAYPERLGWTLRLVPLREALVRDASPLLTMLMGAAALILLIACVNIANLLLMRATGRHREMAARAALGAGRAALARLLLTETAVLAVAGAGLGLLLAAWGLPWIVRLAPPGLPRLADIGVGWDAVAFTFAVAVLAGALFGTIPALRSSGISPGLVLKDGGRIAGSAQHDRLRRMFVVAELALSLVLLIGAGLLLRTFWVLVHADPGFRPEHVTAASVWMPVPNDPRTDRYATVAARTQYVKAGLQQLEQLPGVESAAFSTLLPLSGRSNRVSFALEGRAAGAPPLIAELISVTPGYFRTLGAHLLSGREFSPEDEGGTPGVVVVDRTTADRWWPGEDAIGRRLLGPRGTFTVVGVIADIKHDGLDADLVPHVYTSIYQRNSKVLSALVRSSTGNIPPAEVQRVLESLDAEVPTFGATTLTEVLETSLAERRFAALAAVVFAAMATLLAAVGLYGVIAYGVRQRTREIGVRLALGARPADVAALLVGETARLVAVGLAIGVSASVVCARALGGLLYGVSATDGGVFAASALLLIAVAGLAAAIPAGRASRLDPVRALQQD